MPDPTPARWKRFVTPKTLLGTAFLIAVVLALVFLPDRHKAWAGFVERFETIDAWVQANLPLACLAFFVGYVLLLTPPIPLAAITGVIGGALFGRWLGTGIMNLAGITCATLAFLLSRYLFRDWVERNFGQRLGALKRGFERDGALYVLALRWIPFIPFALINMGLALTPIRLRKYVFVSWPAMLPLTFVSANAGQVLRETIREVKSPLDAISWPLLLSITLFAIAPLLLKWTLRWFSKRRPPNAD